jgi:hypothetical protein
MEGSADFPGLADLSQEWWFSASGQCELVSELGALVNISAKKYLAEVSGERYFREFR